jgi:small subunit ribosomal protein S8
MVSTDPIADMLTRIRNAIAVRQYTVTLPHSGVKEKIASLLMSSNYISGVSISEEGVKKNLVLEIFDANRAPRITEIKRISSPGRRVYANVKEIPIVKGGRGVVIVSTSKGMMLGHDAKAQNLGGEIVCSIY